MKVHRSACSGLVGLVVLILPNIVVRAESSRGGIEAERRQQVSALIKQLDSNVRKDRVRAERELLKLGPGILPILPAPELLPSASVRDSLRRIRIRLERTKALLSVGPSRVTLVKTLPLAELLKAVSAETGNVFDVSALPETFQRQTVAAAYRDQTFWAVMDDLGERVKLAFHPDNESGRLKLLPQTKTGQPGKPPVAHSGAFRISVLSAGMRPLFGDAAHRLLRIRLALIAEPRLRSLSLQFSGTDISARTPQQQRLEPFNPDAKYELPFGEDGKGLIVGVDFKVPIAVVLKQAALRGTLTLLTAAGSEKIAFTNLTSARNVARRRGGVTVVLQEAAFQPMSNGARRARMRVAVSYDVGGRAFESHRTWMFHNRVYLETKQGRRIGHDGPLRTQLQTNGTIAVEYQFDGLDRAPMQYRFVYVAPTLIINVPVEFEFGKIFVSPSVAQRNPL